MDNGASSYRRFLEGDDSGLVEIIRDYKDGLIFYLNSLVNNLHIAEELAEDTFVRLGTKKPRDKRKSSFKTWLYTIGRNLAIDYIRRESRIVQIPWEDHPELYDDWPGIEAFFLRDERKAIVHRGLNNLSPDYRQVLWLTYFEQFSNREIAAVMKRSVRSIETLVYRARKSLKQVIEKEGFIYEELC